MRLLLGVNVLLPVIGAAASLYIENYGAMCWALVAANHALCIYLGYINEIALDNKGE